MRRSFLAVPLEEIRKHLELNERQYVKIVAPERLGKELFEKLLAQGKSLKQEDALKGDKEHAQER